MYIKTSLSMLACAAVAAAQTTTVPNSGLTPAQSTAIAQAESAFLVSLEANPTFTVLEGLIATATNGPLASYLLGLEEALAQIPSATEPAFIESLAAQASAGASLLPTAVLPFIESLETAIVGLLDEALSTSLDIGGGPVTTSTTKASYNTTLTVSTSTVTGKAGNATKTSGTGGSSSGSSTATSSISKATSGAGIVEGVKVVLGSALAFGAAVMML